MANRYPLQQPQIQPRIDMTMRNNVPAAAYPRPRAGMWPHHQMVEEQNEKQREYLKQQQKLRLMAGTSAPQSVSADALIENLLGKKETFKPKTTHHTVQPGAATPRPLMLTNAAPGMVPPHVVGGAVRPVMGYPLPSGPSSSAMISGYGSPGFPPEAKPTTSRMDVNMGSQAQFVLNLPAWLTPTSPLFPQFYRQVWQIVAQDKGLVDTTRIFPLLLTSGLPTEVLGFIWGLANRKVAGQLTEQELYIVLALVALAQSGCTFNNLSVLNLIPQPPIPNLKLNGFESVGSAPMRDSEIVAVSTQGKMKREDLNLGHLSSVPNQTAPASEPDDTGFDEFTDFQSATAVIPEPTSVSISKCEVPISISTVTPNVIPHLSPPSSTLEVSDNLAAKCPSVMVVSSGHGRGIGSRLANHSLTAPKQKKSKHHHHHHHHPHRSQVQAMPNNPVSVDDDFSDFQRAKEPEENVEAFQKCTIKPMPQGKTYLLKESAIRSEIRIDPPHPQPPEAIKIPSIAPPVGDKDEKERNSPEKSNSDPLSTENVPSVFENQPKAAEGVNLMAVEEDKYSALRNLAFTDSDASPEKPQVFPSKELSPVSDEFGDFLSADPVQVTDDSFADIAAREQAQSVNILDVGSPDMWSTIEVPQTVEFQVDDWGDFQDAALAEDNTHVPAPNAENQLGSTMDSAKLDTDMSAAFMTLDLSSDVSWNQEGSVSLASGLEKKNSQFFPSLSEPPADLNLGGSWDVKLKEENSGEGDRNINVTESGSFQGFLGKIYDDIKLENDFAKEDIFGSTSGNHMNNERNSNFDPDIQIHSGGDDDFGDFVGPDAWTDDQKYNVASKDMLFDGHMGAGLKDGLYGDSQSVSSLELPPLALSRHGSVPSLDLKIFPSTAEKNGGNGGNQPWDMSPQGVDHQLNEWQRCLQSCLTLLQSAVETFSNISSEEVLEEVVGSAEGKDYLQNLVEVAGVSQRVECSYKELASSGEYKKLDSLLADIDSAWTSLEQYYLKADISVDLELVPSSGSVDDPNSMNEPASCCGVCLTDVNCGTKTNNNRNTSQLEYGGHVYHSVCANLWVNCVDSSLPALAAGSGSFL